MDDCIFCSIARGDSPATIRHEDEEFLAFDDLHPAAETHVLVIPRAHHGDLDAWVADGGSSDRMLGFVAATARELGVDGRYRLTTNVGADAGQIIFHQHWHLMSGELPPF